MSVGWECPRCGACYAPTQPNCWTCAPHSYTTSGSIVRSDAPDGGQRESQQEYFGIETRK
jgi:hypothetical protein